MQHEFVAVEDGILEIVGEPDGVKVAGVGTKLAEHAVAKVVPVVVEYLLLLARFWVLCHVADNLDCAVGTRLLTERTGGTLIRAVVVTLEDQASTMTRRHVERSLAVLGILLG